MVHLTHVENYKGHTLKCDVTTSREGGVQWQCKIDGVRTIVGARSSTVTRLLPAEMLAAAVNEARRSVDRMLQTPIWRAVFPDQSSR
jgi:hypothetical protein